MIFAWVCGDLSDAQWAALALVLPQPPRLSRPQVWGKRQLIDGIRWRVRTGARWRDVPSRYGPWQTVHGLFRRWQRDGTWARIITRLQAAADAEGLVCWQVGVDLSALAPASASRRTWCLSSCRCW